MLSDYYNAKARYLLRYNTIDMYQRFGGICGLCLQSENGRDRLVQKISKCLSEYRPLHIIAELIPYPLDTVFCSILREPILIGAYFAYVPK
jgi:hypothetical protein